MGRPRKTFATQSGDKRTSDDCVTTAILRRSLAGVPKIIIGVRPEQRSEPAEDHAATPPRPGRTRERTVEARLPKLRSQRHVGDGAVAEHPPTRIARACRGTSDRVSRRAGEPVARAEPGTLRTVTSD